MGHAVPVTRPKVVLRPQPHGVERIFAPRTLAALHDRYRVVEVARGDYGALDAALPGAFAVTGEPALPRERLEKGTTPARGPQRRGQLLRQRRLRGLLRARRARPRLRPR